ncbi:MAG: CDP-paratose 2-epimerase [candidate division WS2 bacterium]|nr:CDP-paratose 2-epimerase [Candidatus Psychracetigena formicireducens]
MSEIRGIKMKIALVTGSAGLIGAESVRFFSKKSFDIVGIDNDMRRVFFGDEASTEWSRKKLESEIKNYIHYNEDIRDKTAMENIFNKYGEDIKVIIHTAAQPSHDWAAKDPFTDFTVNANGTLTLLEMTRKYCPDAVFIFTSTNKVYGDQPNSLPLVELETRWEIDESHPYYKNGIDESMSVDQTKHSLFGVSKLAADILVQEYGRYFNMKTVSFRGGCLTGPGHSPTELHGFLAYLMKCAVTGKPYTIFGYKGKQVRDNIHSYDLVNAFWHFYQKPRIAEVYNIGGGRQANCSMLEAIEMCEEIAGNKLNYSYTENIRIGDHIWWISDVSRFKSHYPGWGYKYDIRDMLIEIFQNGVFTPIR